MLDEFTQREYPFYIMEHPHSELIEQLGGNRVLCERFRQEQPTISNWRRRGIPWRWRPAIADLAKQQNVEIPDGFLDPIEAA